MKRKNRRHFSYRGANSKRQRLRKEEKKQIKLEVRPMMFYNGNVLLKRNRQRGA